ncbi:redoxin domain-containing protein [Candidatus Kaiserbacteria bacterium]|nr:redoxin domain-containing protein [Candidatus Kaiserbacteria bacterium]
MNHAVRNALLIVVSSIIVASIVFLESQKVHSSGPSSDSNAAIDLDALFQATPTPSDTTSAIAGAPQESTPTKLPRTSDFEALRAKYSPAVELVSPDAYINTGLNPDGSAKPITIASLIGKKVIIVDFWTYSCINCQRNIPYIEAWYEKYKDAGLVVIGVHSPEFEFEKNLGNVQDAVKKFGITYPVILDSEMRTWNAYSNLYWPAHYIIDINGLIVDKHFGEGGYAQTESQIQKLLKERQQVLGSTVSVPAGTVNIAQVVQANSPETYFGASRNEYLGNGAPFLGGMQTYARPDDASIDRNNLYLSGAWNLDAEYAENRSSDARIIYKYTARNVYFVASSDEGSSITVLRDGVPVDGSHGEDVSPDGTVMIKNARLYKLISETQMGTHTLEIIIKNPGLKAYTFTFG